MKSARRGTASPISMEGSMKNSKFALPFASLLLLVWMSSGCSIVRAIVKKDSDKDKKVASAEETIASADAPEPSVRNSILHTIPDVQTVHFEYDSAKLTLQSQAILKKNAQWLKENREVKIQVAGHCDQRGTETYNLALGQNR